MPFVQVTDADGNITWKKVDQKPAAPAAAAAVPHRRASPRSTESGWRRPVGPRPPRKSRAAVQAGVEASNLFGEGACDWHDVMRLKRSDAGAAWFITTGTGTVVCKSITCQEFMGTFVAGELARCMRVTAPAVRVVMWGEDEFAALKSGCLRLVESRAATEGTPKWSYHPIRQMFRFEAILIMELCPGYSLMPPAYHPDKRLLRDEDLVALGRMYCFDIVLNNADRLPGTQFWKHDGNEGNFLFGAEPGELYSIDQCVIVKKFQENYCCQVKELLFGEYVRHLESKVRTGHDANPLPSLTRIVEFLKMHYGGGPLLRAESEEASGDRDHGNNDAKAKRLLLCGFMEAARAVPCPYSPHHGACQGAPRLSQQVENTLMPSRRWCRRFWTTWRLF